MSLFRILGSAAFLIGIVLVVFGVIATQKTGEKAVSSVSGHYTDTTMWYFIGGIALVVGGAGLTRIKD
jgi:succinate dehydrogenase/fumarate reductase cytochrome b subunit